MRTGDKLSIAQLLHITGNHTLALYLNTREVCTDGIYLYITVSKIRLIIACNMHRVVVS